MTVITFSVIRHSEYSSFYALTFAHINNTKCFERKKNGSKQPEIVLFFKQYLLARVSNLG